MRVNASMKKHLFGIIQKAVFCYTTVPSTALFDDCTAALHNTNAQDTARCIISIHSKVSNNLDNLSDTFLGGVSLSHTGKTYSFADGMNAVHSVREMNEILDQAKHSKRIQLIHSLAHIEYNAMKSYLDTSIRFVSVIEDKALRLNFFVELLRVSKEESEHFLLLSDLLNSEGLKYGDLPVHSALIDNVAQSMDCVLTRLALISIISEGKGVDAGERLMKRLKSFNDPQAAKVLDTILREEVGHIAVGNKWFQLICQQMNLQPIDKFLDICERHQVKFFKPFNRQARIDAGYDTEWIEKIWEK